MNQYSYKKISFDDLIKRINKTENNKYKSFINLYIDKYLSKFKINSLQDFIKRNISQLNFYKQYDSNCIIYFHYIVDIKQDKIIAIEKGLDISDKFFEIKYLKNITIHPESIIYATNLYVDEEYRGKSLCKLLLNKMKSNSEKHFKKYIMCEIHNENIPSIKCHESIGFIKLDLISYPNTYFYILNL